MTRLIHALVHAYMALISAKILKYGWGKQIGQKKYWFVILPLTYTSKEVIARYFSNDWLSIIFSLHCILAVQKHQMFKSIVFFSLALCCKMSPLLYFPGFLLVQNLTYGLIKTGLSVLFMILFVVLISLYFIAEHAYWFFRFAYNLGRCPEDTITYSWLSFETRCFH